MGRCPKPFTGWLRSATDEVTLPVAETRALILNAERDSEAIATLYQPPVPVTTASASCQYDLADLPSAVRRRQPRGEWRLVNGDYEWVESKSSSDEPAKVRIPAAPARACSPRGALSPIVAATTTDAGDC